MQGFCLKRFSFKRTSSKKLSLQKFIPQTIFVLLSALLTTSAPYADQTPVQAQLHTEQIHREQIHIAIIIDDIGHNQSRGQQAIDLPASLTYAVIPKTAHGQQLARYAHRAGKEVMVHLPMANTQQQPMGELALTNNLSESEIGAIFDQAVSLVPYAIGINNHMGSELTQQPQAMAWLMRAVKRHKLYFVDSRTTHLSVALEIAMHEHLLSARRDVFLDNDRSAFGIDQQFRRLMKLAKVRQSAIAIGHPYPVTLEYLRHAIPMLEQQGIKIIPVSELMKLRLAQRQLAGGSLTGG